MNNNIKKMLSNFKRTIIGFFYQASNEKILNDGYIKIKGHLNIEEVDLLRESYSFENNDETMKSEPTESRFVFYDLSIFNDTVLNNFYVKRILKNYRPYLSAPSFLMRNIITNTHGLGSGGGWHRDSYTPTLKVFVPLTDCTKANGATILVNNSYRPWSKLLDFFKGPRLNDDDVTNKKITTLLLDVGDIAIIDTSCVHRGSKPFQPGRDMLTLYFSNPDLN